METYISMLRGINVSGQRKIRMEDLKKLYGSLGFIRVQTYIQSGNVVFESQENDPEKLASVIREGIRKAYGFEAAVLVRTAGEMQEVLRKNPLSGKDVSKMHVTFLEAKPQADITVDVEKVRDEPEAFFFSGREIYLFCPNGYGKTRLNNNFFEKKLHMNATTRNWKTVNMLAGMARGTSLP